MRAGRAAMATQAMTNPYLAVDTLAAIPAADAEHALHGALARDPESDRRQAIVIDAQGRIGAWTGTRCEDYAGHAMDEDVAVAGNIIAGRAVLDAMLDAQGITLDHVIEIKVDEQALLARIEKRAAETGGARSDDNADVLAQRLKVYHDNTAPVLPYYRDKGQLVSVDGMQSVEEVSEAIRECFNS